MEAVARLLGSSRILSSSMTENFELLPAHASRAAPQALQLSGTGGTVRYAIL